MFVKSKCLKQIELFQHPCLSNVAILYKLRKRIQFVLNHFNNTHRHGFKALSPSVRFGHCVVTCKQFR